MRKVLLLILCTIAALAVKAQDTGGFTQAEIDSILNDTTFKHLSEVEVKAIRPLVKAEIDRLAYDVQADADAKTSTVIEMLRKVPLVTVDAEDNIRVKGATNFKIYKNGHPDPSISSNPKEVLKAIPASMIKRIEVITEPGAKYDAEGTTVILNIVMADNSTLKGVSGMASANADNLGYLGGSIDLTTQLDKVVMSVDYGIYHGIGHDDESTSSSLNHYKESGAELVSDGTDKTDKMTSQYGYLNASWEPDTLNLVSMSLGGHLYDFGDKAFSTNLMRDAAGQTIYSYGIDNHDRYEGYSMSTRLDYQRSTRLKGETITLSYMLSAQHSKSKDKSLYTEPFNMPVPYNGVDLNDKQDFDEHTVQLDWTRPFAQKKHTIETGVKYIYRMSRSHSMIDYLGIEDDMDMRFKHVTQVGAAYVRYTFASGPWSVRAGLRYEHSYMRASYPDGTQEAFDAQFDDVVPSANVRYKIDDANSLKFSYAASINRPGISYLNPAVVESPTSRSFGNTDLGSVHHHSMSMTFMHVGSKFTFNVTPQFSFSNNGIGSVKWADGLVQVSTFANTLKRRSGYLSAYVQWMAHEKTNIMLNGSVGYNYFKSKELNLKNDGFSRSLYVNVTQYLPWSLEFTGYAGMWGGGAYDVYGHRSSTSFSHGFGLQRSFLSEERLTVQLSASNPFKKYSKYSQSIDQGDVTGWSSGRYLQRSFDISVSFRFGSLKASVKRANNSIQNDDLVGGGNSGGGSSSGGGKGGQ